MNSEFAPARPARRGDPEGLLSLAVDLMGALLHCAPDRLDATIADVGRRLGAACRVPRGIVCRNAGAQADGSVHVTHQWQNAAAEPAPHSMADDMADLATHLAAQLRMAPDPTGMRRISAHQDRPEDADLAAQLSRLGIGAVLCVPFSGAEGPSGFVGFALPRADHELDATECKLVTSVAQAIGAALDRADQAAALALAREQIARGYGRLKTTLGALPELVLEVDATGRYVEVHTADTGQMIVPPEQLIGKLHEKAMSPEIAALNRHAMAEVDAKGQFGPHQFWAQTPRGRRRYALTVSPRAPDRPGERGGYVFVACDTTREWHLAAEAERLGLIARRMTDLVIIIGLDDRIEWVNPAFEARTGWTLDEVRGRTPGAVLYAAETDRAEIARLKAAMAEGRPVRGELLNRSRAGEVFWTQIDLQPLRDSDGTLTGYVSVETDITERKQQAETLEQLARDANEARTRLENAVEALSDAFVYFDAEDRMVLCNSRYRDLFAAHGRNITPGIRFEDAARALAQSGAVPNALGREDAWVASQVEQHRRASGSSDEQLGGKWIRSIERATPDGGRVGMRIDITEIKDAERRLADIIHGARAGTWEWNIPLESNIVNERWAEIVGYTLEELGPLTIHTWERLVHPDDLATAQRKLERVFAKTVDQFEYELRMRHKAGHWVWVMSRGRVARWAKDGTPEVMAGVHIDITALKGAQDRLAEIIDAAEAGTWELDLSTGVKHVNHRWAEMLGYTRKELAHLRHFGFYDLVHPDDMHQLHQQHNTKLAKSDDRFANEIRMRHKAGHWVWVLSRGRVMERDRTGAPVKLAGIHLDITERMRLETQLTAERDYLARLMDTSVSGITALDGDGRIIFANRGAERILGLDAAAITRAHYNDPDWKIAALDGGPLAVEDLPFPRVMSEGRSVRDVRFSISWPDGTRRILSVNAAPINAEGLAVRAVCSINDITEQVAAEQKLREAAERAEQANRTKSLFLANMSHEIRTPLNGILGMAQMLEGELEDQRHLAMLHIISASGETLLRVLNDVLDMSKIEAGKLTLERAPFNPAELAFQVESVHRVLARDKNLRFSVTVAPAAQTPRLGDSGRLAQILHNLVGNAIKFTETGHVTVELGTDDSDALVLVVQDSGIGMTEDQVARVFEDFEQADGTVTRRFGGTGLGMSIVKRLVDLMGGGISVNSAPDLGTRVTVRLPLAQSRAATVPDQNTATGSVAGLRILAADDNQTNRLILATFMSNLGADLVLAEDGRAAVSAWEPGRFDLYLLDISMPELDGIGALAELRALEDAAAQPACPAIALTANVMAHQVAEYRRAGFQGHLGKPFRRNDLIAAILAVLQHETPASG